MTTVKDYIDCPRCGAKKIRADIRMCSECEIDERWIARYQAEVDRANGFAEACRALTAERAHLREEARSQVLAALGHVVEVLDDLKPCGHSGDEETGEHDADCMLCRVEAALEHAEEVSRG
jgi:ribosomal protein L37E